MRGKISRNSKERGRKEHVSRTGKCPFLKKILQKTDDYIDVPPQKKLCNI